MPSENNKSRPLVEVCIGSVADAQAAAAAGADRLELCSATEVGGLTPSAGLIEAVTAKVDLPVLVMIRPRPGGFCYDAAEFDVAMREAKQVLQQNVAGVVFGFLDAEGNVDREQCRQMVELAGDHETVFHRAFDVVPNPLVAVDTLVELGITRLLTSGQEASTIDGVGLIRQLMDRVDGRLQIMPGGGINASNVQAVVEQTGCNQLHIGASGVQSDALLASCKKIVFHATAYLDDGRHRTVDQEKVAQVLQVFS